MLKKGLSQEALKLIACVTMLIDHIGHLFFPANIWLRLIGRLSFPIFCFLLSEGAHYTKDPKKYFLRLLVGMVLSELPFDLMFYGAPVWRKQSVMVTLLLGFVMCRCMMRCKHFLLKALVVLPFALAANCLRSDYGARGIAVIALFFLSRDLPFKELLQFLGLAFLFGRSGTPLFYIGAWGVPWKLFTAAAMVPICLYSGKKVSRSPVLQTAFYLFYPAHLLILPIIFIILK